MRLASAAIGVALVFKEQYILAVVCLVICAAYCWWRDV